MKDLSNYSLLRHNTFGIEARCRRYLEFGSVEEAQAVAALLRSEQQPFLVVGGGSNLLLTRDYEGTVVHSAIRGISCTDNGRGTVTVRCGSGEHWDDVVAWTVEWGYGHLANLSLIPGDVGASVVQNIGAYGAEVCQFVSKIRAVDISTGQEVSIDPQECDYGYRSSRFKREWAGRYLVTQVDYRLKADAPPRLDYGNIRAELERRGIEHPTPAELRQAIIDIRRAKLPDPQVLGNAGSFFVNPVVERSCYERLAEAYPQMPHYEVDAQHEKIPAGWLIEQCGWKGRSLGAAGVHDRQALVLVNRGGATGSDIVALCRAIQRDVKAKFGIDINPEVNII